MKLPAKQFVQEVVDEVVRDRILFATDDPSLMLWARDRLEKPGEYKYLDNPTTNELCLELEQLDLFRSRKVLYVNGIVLDKSASRLPSVLGQHRMYVTTDKDSKCFSSFEVVTLPKKVKQWNELIAALAEAHGLRLQQEAYEYLSMKRGLSFAITEIQKFALLTDVLNLSAIREYGVGEESLSAFNVVEACLSRDRARIVVEAHKTLSTNSAAQIIGILLETFRDLVSIFSFAKASECSAKEVSSNLGVSYYAAKVLLAARTRFKVNDLFRIFDQLVDLDARVKTGMPENLIPLELSRLFSS